MIDADICRNKHGGNPQSEAANRLVNKPRGRQQALDFIRARGSLGATSSEFALSVGKHPHQVSGRFSELKRDGDIVELTDEYGETVVRDGYAVCVMARGEA